MSEIRLARQNVAGSTEVPRRIDSELLVRGATQHANVWQNPDHQIHKSTNLGNPEIYGFRELPKAPEAKPGLAGRNCQGRHLKKQIKRVAP